MRFSRWNAFSEQGIPQKATFSVHMPNSCRTPGRVL